MNNTAAYPEIGGGVLLVDVWKSVLFSVKCVIACLDDTIDGLVILDTVLCKVL